MKRIIPFLSLFVLLCTFLSCKKDPSLDPTIVKGTVVDSKTGAPIAGAVVEFYNTLLDKNNLPSINISETVISDIEGKFSYIVRVDAVSANTYSASAEHYVKKRLGYEPFKITMEETNHFTIPLIRYDAAMRLHIKNESEQDKAVYVVISNSTKLAEAGNSWGEIKFSPLIMGLGEEQTFFYETVANERTYFYWDGNNFYPNITSSFQDSLFFNVGDTLDYTINF